MNFFVLHSYFKAHCMLERNNRNKNNEEQNKIIWVGPIASLTV